MHCLVTFCQTLPFANDQFLSWRYWLLDIFLADGRDILTFSWQKWLLDIFLMSSHLEVIQFLVTKSKSYSPVRTLFSSVTFLPHSRQPWRAWYGLCCCAAGKWIAAACFSLLSLGLHFGPQHSNATGSYWSPYRAYPYYWCSCVTFSAGEVQSFLQMV